MAAAFSIDEFKRKQRAKEARMRRKQSLTSKTATPSARLVALAAPQEPYSPQQRAYLAFCVDKSMDPDRLLLAELARRQFVLKLDRFGPDELEHHMKFLQKATDCRQICLSLGSIDINRDLRIKLDRLGLKRAFAFTRRGASMAVRAACLAASRTPGLVRFQLLGVRIELNAAPLLVQVLEHCRQLEEFNASQSKMGDGVLAGVAVAIGQNSRLQHVSLSNCRLTDQAKLHISKIISLHAALQDEAEWSASLRGDPTNPPPQPHPKLLIDLSHNEIGDDTAGALSNSLFHDKWVLGANLSGNRLTEAGASTLVDTLTDSNRTLAILQLEDMKPKPISASTMHSLEALLSQRRHLLQQRAIESRESQLFLGSLMLKWGVDREVVLELCHDVTSTHSSSASVSNNTEAIATPRSNQDREQQDSVYTRKVTNGGKRQDVRVDNDVSSEVVSPASRSTAHPEVTRSNDTAHIQTIQYLIERLSVLEAEKRTAADLITMLETENRSLREQLAVRAEPTLSVIPMEAELITQLETSINSLAEQVEHIEREKLSGVTLSIAPPS